MSRIGSWSRSMLDAVCARVVRTGRSDADRGDVPGWVLVTLMTAGLVTLLWQTAGPLLRNMFMRAMSQVSGG